MRLWLRSGTYMPHSAGPPPGQGQGEVLRCAEGRNRVRVRCAVGQGVVGWSARTAPEGGGVAVLLGLVLRVRGSCLGRILQRGLMPDVVHPLWLNVVSTIMTHPRVLFRL